MVSVMVTVTVGNGYSCKYNCIFGDSYSLAAASLLAALGNNSGDVAVLIQSIF